MRILLNYAMGADIIRIAAMSGITLVTTHISAVVASKKKVPTTWQSTLQFFMLACLLGDNYEAPLEQKDN